MEIGVRIFDASTAGGNVDVAGDDQVKKKRLTTFYFDWSGLLDEQ